MNKELEALLLMAAKSLRMGVYGVDKDRAAEFGVDHAVLATEGSRLPGWHRACQTTGYYIPSGGSSLTIDRHSPGDGWARYHVSRLTAESTGHYSFSPYGMTLAECKAFLRGIIVAEQER